MPGLPWTCLDVRRTGVVGGSKDKGRIALCSSSNLAAAFLYRRMGFLRRGRLVTQPSRLPDVITFAGNREDELVEDFRRLRRRVRRHES